MRQTTSTGWSPCRRVIKWIEIKSRSASRRIRMNTIVIIVVVFQLRTKQNLSVCSMRYPSHYSVECCCSTFDVGKRRFYTISARSDRHTLTSWSDDPPPPGRVSPFAARAKRLWILLWSRWLFNTMCMFAFVRGSCTNKRYCLSARNSD